MYDFSPDSVLLVLASTHYDGKEYIRNFDEYLKEIKEAVCEQVLAEEEKISLDMALKYDEKKETDK